MCLSPTICCVISPCEMLSVLAMPGSASSRAGTAHLPTHLPAHLQNDATALAEPVVRLLFHDNIVLLPPGLGCLGEVGVSLPIVIQLKPRLRSAPSLLLFQVWQSFHWSIWPSEQLWSAHYTSQCFPHLWSRYNTFSCSWSSLQLEMVVPCLLVE